MTSVHHRTCGLCDALCRIRVEHDGQTVTKITGAKDDPFSMGHICPKAVALADLQQDEDRLKTPLRKTASGWSPVTWDEALDEVAGRLAEVRARHGHDAVGMYLGNPNAHHYGNLMALALWAPLLDSRARFSAQSLDNLPHVFAARFMFGHQFLVPVPDIDRTDLVVVVGANPWVANGGGMSCGHVRRRFEALRARGGRVVVFDPRRTETAQWADEHHFIRPGGDAALWLGVLHTLFEEDLLVDGPWRSWAKGLDALCSLSAEFAPERVATMAGVAPSVIRSLARQLATTPRALIYGRLGTCTQRFGGLTSWLMYAVSVVTNHLDQPGGLMFAQQAVDIVKITAAAGGHGTYVPEATRARGLPGFGDELPVAALADEIETPGPGQVRAMLSLAANPILSAPNAERLEAALSSLDFFVAIDPYLNETSRLADIVLPSAMPLEKDHYPLALSTITVRTVAAYSEALFAPDGARDDWSILTDLGWRLARQEGRWGWRALFAGVRALGPQRILDGLIRTGPHGQLRGGPLTLEALRRSETTVDLGPLVPCLPERLFTEDRLVDLVPDVFREDLARVREALSEATHPLVLIGRRHLQSANSWMHNSHRLVRGSNRCTLQMHSSDAAQRDLREGEDVWLITRVGRVRVRLEVRDELRPGVVSMPHGWGHDRETRQRIAAAFPGVNVNLVTDEHWLDELTGTMGFSGLPVSVERAGRVDASA